VPGVYYNLGKDFFLIRTIKSLGETAPGDWGMIFVGWGFIIIIFPLLNIQITPNPTIPIIVNRSQHFLGPIARKRDHNPVRKFDDLGVVRLQLLHRIRLKLVGVGPDCFDFVLIL
jgi:hypothetical protein